MTTIESVRASFYIDGGWRTPSGSATIPVTSPLTEEEFGSVPEATTADVDAAVAAARTAFRSSGWRDLSPADRAAHLRRFADELDKRAEDRATAVTSENGMPIALARFAEGAAPVQLLRYYADLVESTPVEETRTSQPLPGSTIVRREAIGVVGAIAPWNFPLVLAMFKVGPAILAGNTVVLKPSPFTPLTSLRFGEIAASILPPGVLNVVTGGDALGPWMTEHPGIDKVSFTGSTATGRRVMQSASATLKRVTLELGGNDPAIVLPDVDVEKVAEQLFWAAFRNNGQVCIATKRMYVHRDVYEPLKEALVAYARTVKVGDGAEQGTQIGPLNNRPQYDRVLELIADAKDKGYDFLLGGDAADVPGYFIPVTIIDNPPEDSRIVQEEQFGPVLPLLVFDDLDEAVARANASDYGLGASVWSGDEDAALAVAERIASGTVWINESQHLSPLAPFGGVKQSGVGVEGGVEGLLEYTNPQTVVRRKQKA